MIIFRIFRSFLLFSTVYAALAMGQVTPSDSITSSAGCELQIKAVERVMRMAQERGERIFVISRRSARERKGIDWSRLNYTQAVLIQSRGFPIDQLTISSGELSTRHEGVLQFWVGSAFELELTVGRNRQLCLMAPTQSK